MASALQHLRAWINRSVARRVALSAAAAAAIVSTTVGILIVSSLLADQPAAARRAMTLVAILGGAATVACVTIATMVSVDRLLVSSLGDLTLALREAEKGRWLKGIRTERTDELGELGRSFDRLSATVTDLSVSVIDADRELAWTRRELALKDALSLLFELTQTISTKTDLGAILGAVPERVCAALGFEQMAILLLDEERQEFVVRAAHGIADGAIGVAFPRNDAICGEVADSGEPLIIADTARDARYSHFRGRHPVDGAFACVPMRVHGGLVGLFNVLRPGPSTISENDLSLLTSIASHAGLAIAHAEMTERLRQLAVTDELTGLANRRRLLERAAEEVERSRRSGTPLAALMLDLDHFKDVNDELGHQRGDTTLAAVAHALAGGVRSGDVVGRYGGEEFVVLLPACGRDEALAVADKLRLSVRALDLGRPITVSIGVAVTPGDGDDAAALIGAADRALLEAKRAGRDRVTSTAGC